MRKLTATQIKLIAIIAMTLDHIAFTLVTSGTALHYISHLNTKRYKVRLNVSANPNQP